MNTYRISGLVAIIAATLFMILPLDALAQRRGGGSFGGSRRSYSAPRGGGGSFGGSRRSSPSTAPRTSPTPRSGSGPTRYGNAPTMRNSMGGTRMTSGADYTSRYGTPRRTESRAFTGSNGQRSNYVVNQYGGMGDGFMMGYLMGSIPWYWSMPFHPAFYFSRPYTSVNPDGSTAVYPGTFQWGTLFLTLLIIGGVLFIGYVWLRNRRRKRFAFASATTYDDEGADPGAKSSFL
jgi:cbb3-type cytochrome oxidase subunit 3